MKTLQPWRSAALIVNAHSRKGDQLFHEANDKLRAAGVPLDRAIAERDPSRLLDHVETAVADGIELIIVGGGDGSISGTIGALERTKAVFAPLPLGTANSFARTLGIGVELDDAIDAIVGGHTRLIDLGNIDGHMFANSAVIGLSPIIGDSIPPRLKRTLGRFGYLAWAIRTMTQFRPFRVEVDCDGEKTATWATEVRMLNGRYAGGVELSEDAEIDSGHFEIQIISGKSKLPLAKDWYLRILGLKTNGENLIELEGRRARITTRPVQRVAIDGEVLAKTPITFAIHRRAVNVVVPRADGSD